MGWQDILLRPWTYFVLTVILLLVPLQKLNLDGAVRARVAVITGLGVLGYIVTVYLIFFLTYTPINIDHVRGVQGRYFVIALPMAAIFLASTASRSGRLRYFDAQGISSTKAPSPQNSCTLRSRKPERSTAST